jgi:hypothetical protein
VLVTATKPWGLAVDATSVVWTSSEEGTVAKVPLSGGDVTSLAMGQSDATAIALGGGFGWVGAGSSVVKVALDGSGASLFAATPITHAVAVRDTTVYFSAGPSIESTPMAGGAPQLLVSGDSFVLALAVDAARVYWTASAGDVYSAPIDGGPLTKLAAFQGSPYGIAVDGTNVYWTTQGTMPDYKDGAIMRAPADASGMPEVLVEGEAQPKQLVLDAGTLYWVNYGGALRKMPVTGGVPESLFEGGKGLTALAVDATHVYWGNDIDSTIQKIGK